MGDWRDYDGVAETYERVHASRLAQPAKDLVALAGVGAGQRVLDLGAGTGVVAAAASAAGADAVATDPSLPMLTVGRAARPSLWAAAATAIDLPFANGTFDAVLAGFVLAHFADPKTALFDAIRVTKPGGAIGVSSWSDGRDAFTDAWNEVLDGVMPREMLRSSLKTAIPNHDRFSRPDAVDAALRDAGLHTIRIEQAVYEWHYDRDEYVDGLSVWAAGRLARDLAGDAVWDMVMERAKKVFAERFPDPLHDRRTVLLATARRD
jgi:ubiquinone/menaquinone biosynthesis C-methylase UbiE